MRGTERLVMDASRQAVRRHLLYPLQMEKRNRTSSVENHVFGSAVPMGRGALQEALSPGPVRLTVDSNQG